MNWVSKANHKNDRDDEFVSGKNYALTKIITSSRSCNNQMKQQQQNVHSVNINLKKRLPQDFVQSALNY